MFGSQMLEGTIVKIYQTHDRSNVGSYVELFSLTIPERNSTNNAVHSLKFVLINKIADEDGVDHVFSSLNTVECKKISAI